MRACSRCGEDNPEHAKFCLSCGHPFPDRSESEKRRKPATLLFCDVSGSTAMGERLDAEAVREVMSNYFEEMRRVIEGHGGTVEKFVGDAVMAVFGAPEAHEDDALRACRAAFEMQSRMTDVNEELQSRYGSGLALRIGVNTGEVVATDASTRETFVSGDAVNVAARLEQAAGPGQVLLGTTTYELARRGIAAEPVDPVIAKGKSEPVPAYRLLSVGVKHAELRPFATPFIGREKELATLEDALDNSITTGRLAFFTVLGEPGVGKSRTVSELMARAQKWGAGFDGALSRIRARDHLVASC